MGPSVCINATTLWYPQGGGHFWVFLNWALGLSACGCDVIWLECSDGIKQSELPSRVACLQERLQRYGLPGRISLYRTTGGPVIAPSVECVPIEIAFNSELLLNFNYYIAPAVLRRFRRTALVDIDPGLTQHFIHHGQMSIPPHDVYVTTGETVGTESAKFSDCGLAWIYSPPCVSLHHWPVSPACPGAPYSTIAHWWAGKWVADNDSLYENTKRAGFLPYLSLPAHVDVPLELALNVESESEGVMLREHGWRLLEAHHVARTPWDYQEYIRRSRGEFSCVKPSCVRLQNAWMSDRSLCYLASGKPVVVQHTGASRFLPDCDGLLRFRNYEEAVTRLADAEANYDKHAKSARALAEEFFDAKKVAQRVLEKALV
jgi:hypothetical protein